MCGLGRRGRMNNSQDAFVLVRKDLDELGLRIGPVFQHPGGARTAGQVAMALEKSAHTIHVGRLDQRLEVDAGLVAAARGEIAPAIVDVGDAAAHSSREVAARATKYEDRSVGHVLAAVVADTFNYGCGAGVADRETLAGDSVEEDFAAGCAVKNHVTDQDALLGKKA